MLQLTELAQHEAVIERGLKTFVAVGAALLAIRDDKLYREGYTTFEDYCRERWGMSRIHAFRLIEASEVTENLLPIGNILPATESQARPLTSLPPEQQAEAWQRVVDTAPDGRITAAHVQAVVDDMRQPVPVAPIAAEPEREPGLEKVVYQPMAATVYSSFTFEYYTPKEIIEAARLVLGRFDLDPASCIEAQQNVKAKNFFTSAENGLIQDWAGKVWLNPPYGKTNGRSNQDIWAQRLIALYQEGSVTEAILLVKSALGYKWFEELFANWPVCFVRSRLSFILESGDDDGQSKQGTALFYLGPNFAGFARVFRNMGRIIPPEAELNATLFG